MEPQHRRSEQVGIPTPASVGRRRHAMRILRDDDDEIVLAYEISGTHSSEPRQLVLEWSDGRTTARFDVYPSNWRDLRAADLLALRYQRS